VDLAVIGATHRNLREMIEAGTFREDLYYRLNGLVVRLPALRERRDLDLVAQRILVSECPQDTPAIAPSVAALFSRYAWPGNIRQLANVLRTAAAMAAGEARITEHHLSDDFLEDARRLRAPPVATPVSPVPGSETASDALVPEVTASSGTPRIATASPGTEPSPTPAGEGAAACTLEEAEIEMIRIAVAAAQGNISVASKRLGISRNTIYRKLRWGKPA
jgi:transcriptional regulator of acetoin/glycerol metabolism